MKYRLSFKLDSRSRFLLSALIFFAAGILYYRNIYTARAAYLTNAKERHLALKDERQRLASSMPDIAAQQQKLEALKEEYDQLSSQLVRQEKILPKNVNIPDILKFLVRDKDKFKLKIINIKSRKDKLQEVPLYIPPAESKLKPITYYIILPMELEMFGSFDDIIAYIHNLEKRFPYMRLGTLQIDVQKTSGGQPESFLTVLCLLGRGEEKDVDFKDFQLAMQRLGKLKDIEDPFRRKEKPRLEERLAGMELNGIIWKKAVACAIINGLAYKVGDLIQNKRLTSIDKDSIILEEEDKLYKLTLKGD